MFDPRRLREALNRWERAYKRVNMYLAPESIRAHVQVIAAARLALAVLEQGEKMEWCEFHGASVVEELNGCGGSDLGEHCDRTLSFRFPAALLTEESE